VIDQIATVASNRLIAKDTVEMELRLENETRPLPGQFAHIEAKGVFLRRPISVAGYADGLLRVIIQRVGKGSYALSEMQEGETTRVLAPLGNPFPTTPPPGGDGPLWIVGGGIGVAPLLYLGKKLSETVGASREIRSFLGFREPSLVFGADELGGAGEVELATGGLVTDLPERALAKETPSVIFTCGPTGMLRAVQKICAAHNILAYASLEEHMGCGVGACLVCSCKVRTQSGYEYKRVCYDGPVFSLSEVIFG